MVSIYRSYSIFAKQRKGESDGPKLLQTVRRNVFAADNTTFKTKIWKNNRGQKVTDPEIASAYGRPRSALSRPVLGMRTSTGSLPRGRHRATPVLWSHLRSPFRRTLAAELQLPDFDIIRTAYGTAVQRNANRKMDLRAGRRILTRGMSKECNMYAEKSQTLLVARNSHLKQMRGRTVGIN